MIISRKEYNAFEDRIHNFQDEKQALKDMYEERIDGLLEENAEYRRVIRTIHRLIKKERGVQNYGSVENALNRLETEIDKVEIGE